MQLKFHTLTVLAAAVLALAGLSGVAGAAEAPGAHHAPFAAQARSLGLTSAQADRLQDRVDREVARTGGTQVAANEVRYDGGATVLTLPGQRIARPLTSDRSARGTVHRCPPLYFCTYSEQSYQGTLHMLYHCGFYYVTDGGFVSYFNNQTAGTKARFYDENGDFFDWSRPAVSSEPDYLSGPWIVSIMPCMK